MADPQMPEPVHLPVTLQAKSDQSIVVTGVRVDLMANDPLPGKGSVVKASGCGGGMTLRVFDVDLDGHPVSIKPAVAQQPAGGVKAGPDFPFKVSSGDPEQLSLRLPSVKRDVRFSVTVEWVSEGEPGSVKLDNGGRGFRVMGPSTLPKYSRSTLYARPSAASP
ncbi:hypothetical protein RM863_38625 [Streptomyces sp. DSM 41014]|uniref:TerD domain-containing protein n=1 Tax=Streptomyces hintoniae TaxID=3075521 RepID=A0ABU2UY39_9ACTN|nr:hypothetical protein [Streptomyces sp. DSM 41014]MDT0478048.1 hypothetical protein [Streptomyces sp. DSM 41014]